MSAPIRMHSAMLAVAMASAVAMPVRAQSLAQRVRGVGTGTATLRYTARPGTCGDGRDSFSFGSGMHFGTWYGRSSDGMMTPACEPGPARVWLRVERGTITSMRVSVGPARTSEERPTELGTVASGEAAAFFLALADSAEDNVGRRAIVAAVLADSVTVWPKLLAIAGDSVRASRRLRHDATFWLGQFASAKVAGNGENIGATDDGDDRDDARSAAVFALSQLRGHAGVEPLLQVARTNHDPFVRRKALFWLGESGDPRAIALFREILRGG